MKNILSFLFCLLFLCFFVKENIFAESSLCVVQNYEEKINSTKKSDLSFFLKNSIFSSNIFVETLPNPQIKNWAIKQSEKNFAFSIGNIGFSGIKSRLNNPLWTNVNPLRIFSVPKLFNEAKLPNNISNSENYSLFVKFNPKFATKFLGLIDSFEISSIWTPDNNGGSFLSSLIFPFYSNKVRFSLSSTFATSFVKFNDSSWYMESKYFNNQRLNKFLQEINFSSKNFGFYNSLGISSDPFEKLKIYTRNDLFLNLAITKKLKYETEVRFFYSQNDFITLDGKILKSPLSFAILPKFTFFTGTSNLIFAFGYDCNLSYSKGKEKNKYTQQDFQLAFKMEFLHWNLTSKFKYNLENKNFEIYNFGFFHFLSTEKINLTNSTWFKILLFENDKEYEVSCGTKFASKIYASKGIFQNEISTKFISNFAEEEITLDCKAKLSWKSLWISVNFSDIEFSFADKNEVETSQIKKGDSQNRITFSISSGLTMKF